MAARHRAEGEDLAHHGRPPCPSAPAGREARPSSCSSGRKKPGASANVANHRLTTGLNASSLPSAILADAEEGEAGRGRRPAARWPPGGCLPATACERRSSRCVPPSGRGYPAVDAVEPRVTVEDALGPGRRHDAAEPLKCRCAECCAMTGRYMIRRFVAPSRVASPLRRRTVAAVVVGRTGGRDRGVGGRAPPSRRRHGALDLVGHGNGHGIGHEPVGRVRLCRRPRVVGAQILDHYYGGTVAGTADPTTRAITVRLMNLDDAADRGRPRPRQPRGRRGGRRAVAVSRGPRDGAGRNYTVWARATPGLPIVRRSACRPDGRGRARGLGSVDRPHRHTDTSASADSPISRPCANRPARCARTAGHPCHQRHRRREPHRQRGAARAVPACAVVASEMSPSWARRAAAARAHGAAGPGRRGPQLRARREPVLVREDVRSDLPVLPGRGVALQSVGPTAGGVRRRPTPPCGHGRRGAAGRLLDRPDRVDHVLLVVGRLDRCQHPAVPRGGGPRRCHLRQSRTTPGATVTASVIEAAWPSIGDVPQRHGDGSLGGGRVGRAGRCRSVSTGTSGSVELTGDTFRRAVGMRSDWFSIRGVADAPGAVPASGASGSTDPCEGRVDPPSGQAAPAAAYATIGSNRPVPIRLIPTPARHRQIVRPLTGATCTVCRSPGGAG
jgi:hypothetical protein